MIKRSGLMGRHYTCINTCVFDTVGSSIPSAVRPDKDGALQRPSCMQVTSRNNAKRGKQVECQAPRLEMWNKCKGYMWKLLL